MSLKCARWPTLFHHLSSIQKTNLYIASSSYPSLNPKFIPRPPQSPSYHPATRNFSSRSKSSSNRTDSDGSGRRKQMRMLIVGCPGSGKGTQSSRLLKKYDFNVITAGDLLRHHIEQGTPIGRRASEVIRSGGLMPDEIMMELVGKEVEALEDQDWLLDGFPRTLGQAILLDRSLEERGRPLDLVVNLDVPEDVILERILNRWTHLPSGRVYNLSFNPPKVAGKDDVTGEDLVQREDDNAETFSKRLRSFHQLTEPMLDHYREKSKRTSRGGKEKEEELFVNLRGSTSDEIFPHLDELVRTRFPDLVKR